MKNHEQNKKVKDQDSMGKTNFFFAPCPLALEYFQLHGYL
jgi:hypothetical protein